MTVGITLFCLMMLMLFGLPFVAVTFPQEEWLWTLWRWFGVAFVVFGLVAGTIGALQKGQRS